MIDNFTDPREQIIWLNDIVAAMGLTPFKLFYGQEDYVPRLWEYQFVAKTPGLLLTIASAGESDYVKSCLDLIDILAQQLSEPDQSGKPLHRVRVPFDELKKLTPENTEALIAAIRSFEAVEAELQPAEDLGIGALSGKLGLRSRSQQLSVSPG